MHACKQFKECVKHLYATMFKYTIKKINIFHAMHINIKAHFYQKGAERMNAKKNARKF